ncbi:MAG: DUF5666 domain-containing protein [Candidatus Sulfotelmatobacter sp.]|jgi:hypothetical protein
MGATTNRWLAVTLGLGSALTLWGATHCYAAPLAQQSQQAPQNQQTPATNRRIGVVKAINGAAITLTPDSGPDVTVTVQVVTRIVRIAPGDKNLKNAAPLQLQDVQIGDRILVGGKASEDNQSFVASSIVVMKRSDLQARHEQDLQDWQKRGVDGLAKAVDAAAGTVTVSVRGKDLIIHTSHNTVFRRYAPNSVKFDDATSSTLQELHPGDQVRARGDRSADGSALTAEEIVSGAFPLFAGTVNSVDASSSTLTVHDLLSKKNLVVRVTQDSQLRHLPPEMAQRIAMRLKGAIPGVTDAAASRESSNPGSGTGQTKREQSADSPSSEAATGGEMGPRRNGMGGRPGGAPDFQQILSHAPTVSLSDLHKGDAVVILATESKDGSGTAIKLFSGVEPILQAAPNAAQAMMLAPWSLGGPSGDMGGP